MIFRIIRSRLNLLSSYILPPKISSSPKRKVLLLLCHPMPESFSTELSKAVERGLLVAGHEVRLRRLYFHGNADECYAGKSFNPVLSYEERKGYNDFELMESRRKKIENISENYIAPEVKQAVSDLRWCNSVVFVYPTWWFNLPATLKGYFDRVYLPGVAFERKQISNDAQTFVNTENTIQPSLKHIEKLGVVTTYGSPWLIVLYAGDNARRFISRGLRAFYSSTCTLSWHGLYEMDLVTKEQRKKFLESVEDYYKHF